MYVSLSLFSQQSNSRDFFIFEQVNHVKTYLSNKGITYHPFVIICKLKHDVNLS